MLPTESPNLWLPLVIKGDDQGEYFPNFFAINNDLSVDLSTGATTIHDGNQPKWIVHLADTGQTTMTGGRVKRLKSGFAEMSRSC